MLLGKVDPPAPNPARQRRMRSLQGAQHAGVPPAGVAVGVRAGDGALSRAPVCSSGMTPLSQDRLQRVFPSAPARVGPPGRQTGV
jgi:hypothetical protein